MSFLSLYIPIISEKISEQYIITTFQDKNIGKVMRIDFVKNLKKNRREAFIHFSEWFDDKDECKKLKENILDNDTNTKFYHTHDKFWPILINKNAHKKNVNPDYQVLNNNTVKTVFASSLNIIKAEKKSQNNNTKKCKKE